MDNPKPVLVTGATGSIGSVLVKRLSESGQAVRALARNPSKAVALQNMANVEIFVGDLSQPESLHGCAQGCSLVYHCAGKLPGSRRAEFFPVNVTGTEAIIGEAVRSDVERFIHLSTRAVYGLFNERNITEEYPLPAGDEPYQATKQEAEHVVLSAGDKIPVTVARLGDVVGPSQYIWTINSVEKLNQGLLSPPLDSQSGNLNPVFIDNLIDALLLMGAHNAAKGQVFNVVDGTPMLISDYFRRMAEMAGKRTFALPVIVLKGASALLMTIDRLRGRESSFNPRDIDYLLNKGTISGEKIRSVLGWTPAVQPEEAFRRTEQWLRREGYLAYR